MLVSILIPCHNTAPHLAKCIESALNQSYAEKEIILIDDGSSDHSSDIAHSYPEVKVFQQENLGASATRNRLLEESSGAWIQYLDADDYLLPDKIEQQLSQPDKDIYIDAYKILLSRKAYSVHFPPADPLTELVQGFGPQTNSYLWSREILLRVKTQFGQIWRDLPHSDLWLLLDCLLVGARVQGSDRISSVYRKSWSDGQISARDKEARSKSVELLKARAAELSRIMPLRIG